MQDVIANLRLRERAELGRFFHCVIEQSSVTSKGLGYNGVRLDPKPEWIFVFGSSKKLHHTIVRARMNELALGAMAFYGKERSLTIVDRDGVGYEVLLRHNTSPPTSEEREAGERWFGHLRIVDRPLTSLLVRLICLLFDRNLALRLRLKMTALDDIKELRKETGAASRKLVRALTQEKLAGSMAKKIIALRNTLLDAPGGAYALYRVADFSARRVPVELAIEIWKETRRQFRAST